ERLGGRRVGAGFECLGLAALERPASVAADGDLGDLVPLGVESPGNGACGSERDLVLARAAAREDDHAEAAAGGAHPLVVVVVVPAGEYWPIVIVTVEPFVAREPPSGFCDWTRFC